MKMEHISEVLRIERDSELEPWTRAQFIQELDQSHSHCLVAIWSPLSIPQTDLMPLKGDQVVGYHCFWCVADELQILNIAVDQKYRRRGIGRLLMKWGLNFGCRGNAVRAFLEVRKSNSPARRFYEELGFQVNGERQNYYGVVKESALLMSLNLDRYGN
jgi:ribosomal-protein-alanine N-acetyltransferase